jgi:hypothetical protein
MRPKALKTVSILAFLLALLATPATQAQNLDAGDWELGIGVGITNLDVDLEDDQADRFEIRGGRHFRRGIQLEGQLIDLSADSDGADITLDLFMVNGVFNWGLKNKKIVPYTLIGIGTSNFEVDPREGESVDDSSFAIQTGIGSRFFFSDRGRTALRVELSLLSEDGFDGGADHLSFTVGLTWRLGR